MSARPRAAATIGNFAIFMTISVVSISLHYYKQLITTTLRSKLPEDKRKKLVIISGCDQGFGRLLAEQLFDATEHVVLALTLTKAAANELNASSDGKRLFAIQCDVTSEKDIEGMKKYAGNLMQEENIVLHTIVNNAGIADPGDFVWFSDISVYQKVMDVNFFGQLRVTQALLPLMLRTSKTLPEGARILNMSSVCGTSASPSNSSYAASKFAIEAWSDSLRIELKPFNISVVKIRPGQIDTQIQKDYAINLLKNYARAPTAIRELYGGDKYSDYVKSFFEGLSISGMKIPKASLVVDALMDMMSIDKSKLEPYYWIGQDAQTLWRALHSLPTAVTDTMKSTFLTMAPIEQSLPPTGIISHVTIRVKSIEKSLSFYTALGLEPVDKIVDGKQFLQQGASKSKWSTMVLLVEDVTMAKRGKSSDAGMTRLCIYSKGMYEDVKRLSDLGMDPIAPVAVSKGGAKIAAFYDPDNFVVYLIQFSGMIGFRSLLDLKNRDGPYLFHWTINVSDAKVAMPIFEALGFKTLSDQNKDQVIYDLLPAFNVDPETTIIDHIRLCKKPGDTMVATLMEWVTPKSSKGGAELLNSMTISVTDVYAALEEAKDAGMTITQQPEYRCMPVYGEVLVGIAVVEESSNPIEFCSFTNKKY
jgi:NAD(P)-dependent dehydrogenase (short-subunit alcohol dehydrogenase family)/catechol 2,3-dioxygenase-like lactoylglutathione lyase family enzyme